MSKSKRQQQLEQQRRDQYHSANLSQGGIDEREAAQVLKELSEDRDLPINPEDDEIMGQLTAQASSEAKLTEEERRSIEWEREIDLVMWLCNRPQEDGSHGSWRAWQHGDSEEELEPLTPKERMVVESLMTSHKEILSRSDEGFAITESLRNVSESYVNEPASESGGGGLLGRFR